MIEIRCIVNGKVQGVRYRDYVQVSATNLSLGGYVKNESDGSVFVLAQGIPDALHEFIEHLHEGSLQARVDTVSVDWKTAKKVYDDFSIRF
ncbi:acylphosphatase [Candidatus Kaiserbacteria bacterium]|nr:acylphosphatase [Candidatus Kaiserbacteria bacterium]